MKVPSILKKILPTLGAALPLPPPLGVLASQAIGKALGVENLQPEGVEDAIAAAQSSDPDILVKLKAVETDFQLRMAELGFANAEKLEELATADRASARLREIAVKDRIPAILAIGVTLGFFSLLAVFCFRELPQSSATILNIMVGSLGTAWAGVISYYFGSSSGSADKSRTIAGLTEAKQR